MKYLILGDIKSEFYALPSAQKIKLLESAANWAFRYKSANILAPVYMLAGWDRIVALCNMESHDEIVKVVGTMPLKPYMNFEVYPLTDITEYLNSLAAAAKST